MKENTRIQLQKVQKHIRALDALISQMLKAKTVDEELAILRKMNELKDKIPMVPASEGEEPDISDDLADQLRSLL